MAQENLHPVLPRFDAGREAQKARYLGEVFPIPLEASVEEVSFLEFFQTDREIGGSKAMVAVDLAARLRIDCRAGNDSHRQRSPTASYQIRNSRQPRQLVPLTLIPRPIATAVCPRRIEAKAFPGSIRPFRQADIGVALTTHLQWPDCRGAAHMPMRPSETRV